MIQLWAYHWRMGRAVERLYQMAAFDWAMGAERMRVLRSEFKFYGGEQWATDEMMIMRRRPI